MSLPRVKLLNKLDVAEHTMSFYFEMNPPGVSGDFLV